MEVWLGLQFRNEQIGEDAVDICKYVQQFVPGTGFSGLPSCTCKSHLAKIAFGGDQVMVERVKFSECHV